MRALSCVVLLVVVAASSRAQSPGTGAIAGTVNDPSGAALSQARVRVTSVETNVVREAASAADGSFRVALLPPGSYSVVAEASGFARTEMNAVHVGPSETVAVMLQLAVGAKSETVEVSGFTEGLQTESSTLGGVVSESAIRALPLSGRNYTQILGLSPGVIADLPTTTVLGNGTQNVAANGATPTANNIQFNGVDANNLQENSAASAQNYEVGTAIPAPDTIEEFRVQTANYDAAYGRGTGANVDLVSKGGSNEFHGSAWEFVRNNIFNANDFFSKLAGQPRADLKQNEFGGAVGGPIKRDRLFFFGSYQGVTQVNGLGTSSTAILPQFTADRSAAALGAQFCAAGHLNSSGQPSAGYQTAAGGAQVACDGSNINPVALAVLNAKLPNGQFAVPSPQVALPPSSGSDPLDQLPLGLSIFTPAAHYREDQFSVNLDQVLTQKNTLSERFFYSKATANLPFSPNGANVPGWGTEARNRNTMFVMADTHVFNSRLVNIARFGYMRFDGLSSVENPIAASAVGIGTPTGVGVNMPSLSIGGFTIGDGGTPFNSSVTNSFIWQDTVAWTRGRHSARFGVEFKRHQVDENQPQQTDGNLIVPGIEDFLVGQSAAENGSPLGLSNVGLSIAGSGIFRRDGRYTNFAGFVQDDVKLTRSLTLNAGLRYEIFGAPVEAHGRLTNFDPSLATIGAIPDAGTYAGFTVPSNFVGAVPMGVVKNSYAGFYRTPYGDVSPRLGFAWQAFAPVVVRGGVGVYFDEHSANVAEQMLAQPPFALMQFQSGAPNGPATLASPFVPMLLPPSSFPVFQPLTPAALPFIEGVNPNLKDGKTYEYNVNVQYGMGRGVVLQVGYVGTQSMHRPGQIQFDQALLASPEHPVNGETTNSTANVIARMPVQGLSPGSLYTDSVFVANYNALQARYEQRMVGGLTLLNSFTWEHSLDNASASLEGNTPSPQDANNIRADYSQSDYNLPIANVTSICV